MDQSKSISQLSAKKRAETDVLLQEERLELAASQGIDRQMGIAISATFTVEPLEESLSYWMQELDIPAHIEFAPYNQVFQQLLDPSSLLAQNRQGINVVLLRLDDWLSSVEGEGEQSKSLEERVHDFVRAVESALRYWSSSCFVGICPASPAVMSDPVKQTLFLHIENLLVTGLSILSGVYLIESNEWTRLYPVAEIYDPYADRIGHIPFTPQAFAAMGTLIARKIYALRSTPYKVLVLDCDQTLWQGVCGEDGPLGIVIDPARRALQEFVVAQKNAGMLICLCSKNNPQDVYDAFAHHPEMPLQMEHIICSRLNWEPKSQNLRSLAQELNLSLESFIFIDDSPVECAEVQANVPEVLTFALPQVLHQLPHILEHFWGFDRLKVTKEDNRRTILYEQHMKRIALLADSPTLQDFLEKLHLEIQITMLSDGELERVAQLTQRTNQFNCTTIRRSEREIQHYCHEGGKCLVVCVHDRFGDYGLVGVVLYALRREALEVDTFLLSCRVLGKGVEHRILSQLGQIAQELGLSHVLVPFIPTQKNKPALEFLESVRNRYCEVQHEERHKAHSLRFVFPVDAIRDLVYRPLSEDGHAVVADLASASVEKTIKEVNRLKQAQGDKKSHADNTRLYTIATQLNSVEQVAHRLRSQKREGVAYRQRPVSAPRNFLEEHLVALWQELLKLEQISIYDNFFELGGHSLMATQLVSRIRAVLQVELPLRSLFEAPTITQLAQRLEAIEHQELQEAEVLLERVLLEEYVPLSFAQQRLWFLDRLEPEKPFYNIPAALRLAGTLNVAVLQESLNELVRRHESLRTTFAAPDGVPIQIISAPTPLLLPVIDLSTLPDAERMHKVQRLMSEEARRPFDLAHGPLLRVVLLRLCHAALAANRDQEQEEHVLLLNMHHIISDGWSVGVLWRELSTLYAALVAGQPSPLAELPLHYADYTVWQRKWLQGNVLARQVAYWKEQLLGAPDVLKLPIDHPRPLVQTFRGAYQTFVVSKELLEQLKTLSRQEGVTLFMTLLAAFQVLLARYTGQEDIMVGTPIANRTRSELEGLIGFFVNTLVLRLRLAENPTVRQMLTRVREVALGAYEHQDLPFEKLVDELAPQRDLSRNPLFQVLFALQNMPQENLDLPGLRVQQVPVELEVTRFDLELELTETEDRLIGTMRYSTDLFDASTIIRLLAHFQSVLSVIVADPDQRVFAIPLLTLSEQQQMLQMWNQTGRPYAHETCLHTLFEEQVERTPEAVAVLTDDDTEALTYAQLNRRANQLAHYLRAQGVGPETTVGLCLERSPELLVDLLGILKAGGAYVPLDVQYPTERLAFMLTNAQVSLIVTTSNVETGSGPRAIPTAPVPTKFICLDRDWETIATYSTENPHSGVQAENLAYIIYTSGSTGTPKGVGVSHHALVNRLLWSQEVSPLREEDRVLQIASISFDIALWELLGPLMAGAQVLLGRPGGQQDSAYLADMLVRKQVTVAHFVPSLLRVVLEEPGVSQARQLRLVCCGGEAWLPGLAQQFLKVFPTTELVQFYGPTEASINATSWQCNPIEAPVVAPIGRPIANMQVYLLDAHGQPVPVGVAGEVYLGGRGLARGYVGRPDLSAERFVPDPFATHAGARLYRTGDLARYLPTGDMHYLGRGDQQVKIRGFRIELGEIETVLLSHPAVQEAIVLAREDEGSEKRLVAYVVMASDTSASDTPAVTTDRSKAQSLLSRLLQEHLRTKLPEYMQPSAFVVLEAFPLNVNGKIDRSALPAPDQSHLDFAESYVAPRTSVEDLLATIWTRVLKLDHLFAANGQDAHATRRKRLSIYDNFFQLGGHSLLATQVIAHVREAFQIELPLRSLFEAPTLAGLAERIEVAQRVRPGPEGPTVIPVSRDDALPLSFAQQRLWFLYQWEPQSPYYNVPIAHRLVGTLDVDILERCLNEIVRRHEVLRTTFAARDGHPVQLIAPTLSIPLRVVTIPEHGKESALQRILSEEARKIFDLEHGPLIRATVLMFDSVDAKLHGHGIDGSNPGEQVLLICMHHIISDAWSSEIFYRELSLLYAAFSAGRPSPLPELTIQYADYAIWQRQWLQGEILESQMAYWKKQLTDSPGLLELPTDHPRPALRTYSGSTSPFVLSQRLSQALRDLSQREGVTLFMTLLLSFQILLARYARQEELLVGTPIANRTRSESADLIGFFANTLVLRSDLSGNPTVRQALARIREVALQAYAHQDLPFEKLVEELQPERNLSHNPLFQVFFTLEHSSYDFLNMAGLQVEHLPVELGVVKADLDVNLSDAEQGIGGTVSYNTDLFEVDTIARMVTHYVTLLESMVAYPEQHVAALSMLPTEEQHLLLYEWNHTTNSEEYVVCLHTLFEQQVARTPEARALSCEGETLTYAQLNTKANQLAHYLRSLGVGPDMLVGLCLERSLDLIVGMLAILKAGGAYLPLDPMYPRERLAFMLSDARASLVVTSSASPIVGTGQAQGTAPVWFEAHGVQPIDLNRDWSKIATFGTDNPVCVTLPEHLAYVIYTSGSTGTPKGVVITHANVHRLFTSTQDWFHFDETDVWTLFHSYAFDFSVWEIWGALLYGGRLVIVPYWLSRTPEAFYQLLSKEGVTVLNQTPSAFRQLIQVRETTSQTLPLALRYVIFGGEALDLASLRPWTALQGDQQPKLVNMYGITETTVHVTYRLLTQADLDARRGSVIGRALPDLQVYILDEQGQLAPIGVPGELYVAGMGLARGYLGRPEVTAERFVPHPFVETIPPVGTGLVPVRGARLYKTGDVGRYLPTGDIEYLGRADQQVKIRGFRIELGEIEVMLMEHPEVREAVVVMREDMPGEKHLVAYITARATTSPARLLPTALRTHLQTRLPDYMLPAAFVLLEQLPLTSNGKVDRRALPVAELSRPDLLDAYVAPRTPLEEVLAAIWAEVLWARHSSGETSSALSATEELKIGIFDNFFELGGHSLLATQVIAHIREVFRLELPLRRIFEFPTIAALAEIVLKESEKPENIEKIAQLMIEPLDDEVVL